MAQRHRRWPSITSAFGQCIVLSGWWLFWRRGQQSVTRIVMRQQTRENHPMLFQSLANVEDVGPTLGEWHVSAGVLQLSIQQNHSFKVVLGQRSRRFVGIETAKGCVDMMYI